MKKREYYIFISVIAGFVLSLAAPSCANTTTPPSGGAKDTIPPIALEAVPVMNSVNHPTHPKKSQIAITFNEYVVLKDPINNIFLSPPQKKKPQAKIKGKSVVVSFQDTLLPNTSYCLNFGESIADNNEGNIFPPLAYSFSTGDVIDSIYMAGTVVDAKTMFPLDKITILLHTDPGDSAIFNLLPIATARSDKYGYFAIRNIKPGRYRVFAIDDKNNNFLYDPAEESVAFCDTLFLAQQVIRDSLPELITYDEKDTLGILSRPSSIQLNLFKEVSSRQFVKEAKRLGKRMFYIKFAAPNAQIDSLELTGIDNSRLISQFNITRDSLAIWVNDQGEIADTLHLNLKYMKTDDSLKQLVPFKEQFQLPYKKKFTTDNRGKNVEVVDTAAKYTLTALPEKVEQDGITIEFDYPLIKAPFDSILYQYTTPKQQIKRVEFTVSQDTSNLRRYIIKQSEPFMPGNEYLIKIPSKTFYDINGLPCDSLEKKITLPNDDRLSSLSMEMKNVNGNYIVELISEKRDKVFRKYTFHSDTTLFFPYLSAAKYSIRVTEDGNKNEILDTGSLLDKKQPEKVILYKAGSGNTDEAYLIPVIEKSEMTQTIDISEMFK